MSANCSPAPVKVYYGVWALQKLTKRFPVPMWNVCVLNFEDQQIELKELFKSLFDEQEILNMNKYLWGKPFDEQFDYYQKNMKWISNYSS